MASINIVVLLLLLANFLEIRTEKSFSDMHYGPGISGYRLNSENQCVKLKRDGGLENKDIGSEVEVDEFIPPEKDPLCLSTLDKWSRVPECGTDNYDDFAYCAKANFYGKDGLKGFIEKKKYWDRQFGEAKRPKKVEDMEDKDQFYWLDMMLVLVEGCIECHLNPNVETTLTFYQLLQEGPIPSKCEKGQIELGTLTIDSEKPFKIALMPSERLCPSRTQVDEDVKLAKFKNKYNITLEIKHNCGGEITTFLDFLELDPLDDLVKNHVLQIRGLRLKLSDMDKHNEHIKVLLSNGKNEEGFAGKYVKMDTVA